MSTVIGIDPGKDGFLTLLRENGATECEPTPTVSISKKGSKRDYDVVTMRDILHRWSVDYTVSMVVIEKQQAFQGQGVSSTFTTGRGYGIWIGLAAGLGLPSVVVHPRTWQRVVCAGVPGNDPKGRAIIAAGRLFPGVDLRKNERCRVPHDGKADSLLLAWYGRHEVLRNDPSD